jgi:hypothetical protein
VKLFKNTDEIVRQFKLTKVRYELLSFDSEIIDEFPCIYIEGMSRDYCRDRIRADT